MSELEYAAMVELAAKHLTLVNCPAQETIQLQVQELELHCIDLFYDE